jgi:hypothetical protein
MVLGRSEPRVGSYVNIIHMQLVKTILCPPSYVAPPSNNQAATLQVQLTCRMAPVDLIGSLLPIDR